MMGAGKTDARSNIGKKSVSAQRRRGRVRAEDNLKLPKKEQIYEINL